MNNKEKKNPFASFAANGWLTTKKRGQDDAAINRDAERAMQARKKARSRKPPKAHEKKKKTKRKKKKKHDYSDDDILDGFVVDDDEISYDEREESDEEEDIVAWDVREKKRQPKKATSLNDTASLSSPSSSEDEDTFLSKSATAKVKHTTSRPMPKRPEKRLFQATKTSSFVDSDSEEEVESPLPKSSYQWQEEKKEHDGESSSCTELEIVDTPVTTKSQYFSSKRNHTNDFISDDDEAQAVAWAIQESLNQQEPKRKRLKKKTLKKKSKRQRVVVDISDNEGSSQAPSAAGSSQPSRDEPPKKKKNEIITLDDPSESSSDQEDAEVDVYVDDEGAKEARSVLEAANALSAKVLDTMTAWCSNNSSDNDDKKKNVPQGMIVNGALALNGYDSNQQHHEASNQQEQQHASWISQEEMKRICPMVELANYQLVGVNWLALLHGMTYSVQDNKKNASNVNGVLADEMGLGKTVQTICFLAWLQQHKRKQRVVEIDSDVETKTGASSGVTQRRFDRPHIIIVPASVLTNWQREFERFCPDMTVVKYHGSVPERTDIQERLRMSLPDRDQSRRQPLDVVLTTFSYFSSEKANDRNFLRKFHFDYMVVDEAHCLKNPRGFRYRNLDKFETSHRLLLTGTPVQNSPKELMSLLCFLMPLFTPPTNSQYDFEESTRDGGESMLQHFVSLESDKSSNDGGDATANAYRKLKQLFAPFVLRRRKCDVLAQIMPPKVRKLEVVPFDEQTRTLYDSILVAHLNGKENTSTESAESSASAKQHLFTQLRKAANHPLLLRTRHTSYSAVEDLSRHLFEMGYFGRDTTCTIKHVQKELETFSDFDIHDAALTLMDQNPARLSTLDQYTLDVEDLFCSPKFVRLRTMLPDLINQGHRVLVYSQWTRCLDLLGCLMESLGFSFLRLDGQTAVGERQELIDKFNQDGSIPVFLLSTRAGGMGINLTAADTCLLHDVDFNPFNDLQAEDRCHRLGQKKTVTVIKMVTEGTVDMDIYKMQQDKVQMNAAILENDGDEGRNHKCEESEEINKILDNAVNRFLSSPKLNPKLKQNKEEDGILI